MIGGTYRALALAVLLWPTVGHSHLGDIRPNAEGGFDILLRPTLTERTLANQPPPMEDVTFVGNQPRPRPPQPQDMPKSAPQGTPDSGGIGDMMNSIFVGPLP